MKNSENGRKCSSQVSRTEGDESKLLVMFCLNPKTPNIEFIIKLNKKKQRILTVQKLEPANIESIIKMVVDHFTTRMAAMGVVMGICREALQAAELFLMITL